jgi:hypothetical protein
MVRGISLFFADLVNTAPEIPARLVSHKRKDNPTFKRILVLNLLLHVLDRVIKCLAGEGLDEDLHPNCHLASEVPSEE